MEDGTGRALIIPDLGTKVEREAGGSAGLSQGMSTGAKVWGTSGYPESAPHKPQPTDLNDHETNLCIREGSQPTHKRQQQGIQSSTQPTPNNQLNRGVQPEGAGVILISGDCIVFGGVTLGGGGGGSQNNLCKNRFQPTNIPLSTATQPCTSLNTMCITTPIAVTQPCTRSQPCTLHPLLPYRGKTGQNSKRTKNAQVKTKEPSIHLIN